MIHTRIELHRVNDRIRALGSVTALIVAWAWTLVAGVGGFVLLVHQGPLPITNGWFALFSGLAACPLMAPLLKKYAGVAASIYAQLAVALLIFVMGRIAVVILLHRPFLPQCSADCW
jgi:TctA family transporter